MIVPDVYDNAVPLGLGMLPRRVLSQVHVFCETKRPLPTVKILDELCDFELFMLWSENKHVCRYKPTANHGPPSAKMLKSDNSPWPSPLSCNRIATTY